MPVKPIPDGFSSITPYFFVSGVPKFIEFLKSVFDAVEDHRTALPDGTVLHAQVRIGGSPLMMAEARPPWSPTPGSIYLYVEDSDAVYERALRAGATSVMAPSDEFHGDRYGGVRDPFGNLWWIATHIEDVPPDELARRTEKFIRSRRGA